MMKMMNCQDPCRIQGKAWEDLIVLWRSSLRGTNNRAKPKQILYTIKFYKEWKVPGWIICSCTGNLPASDPPWPEAAVVVPWGWGEGGSRQNVDLQKLSTSDLHSTTKFCQKSTSTKFVNKMKLMLVKSTIYNARLMFSISDNIMINHMRGARDCDLCDPTSVVTSSGWRAWPPSPPSATT